MPSRAAAQLESKSFGDIGHSEYDKYKKDHFYSCNPVNSSKETTESERGLRCSQSKKTGPVDLAIIGDSHADHLLIGLAEGLPEANVAAYTHGSMPYLSNIEFNDIFRQVIADDHVKTVILAGYWSKRITRVPDGVNFEHEFVKTVDALTKANKKVFIAEDVPDFSFDPKKCKYSRPFSQGDGCIEDNKTFYKKYKKYYPIFESLAKNNPKVEILETALYFCDSNNCAMAKDGNIFYRDNDHLNIIGSKYLGQKITENNLLVAD